MIISASYRTDIPAFYSDWLFHRLGAGYCRVKNPYSGRPIRVDLRRQSVTGFVFWTRNFGPCLERLAELRAFGRPYTVQFTITNYPRSLEAAVIDPRKAVEQIRRLNSEVHPKCPVWRYDPVVFTDATDLDFHRRNFETLAGSLEGAVDEVTVSFATIYRKSERNLDAAAERHGFFWSDPDHSVKTALLEEFSAMAASHGMTLTICTQPQFLSSHVEEARCVDARRLGEIAGERVDVPLKGNRPGCACHESRDIGAYDTCPHGCVYCYAVRRRDMALARYKAHDPTADALVPLDPEQPALLPLLE
ncbi:DUF1848 domain-containing protein [uncultured Paludibaculum sp.]|uniref:DUF1848 domain-containing protein n=1 Tax=uncultured Paludibaculum sp. TaxID=1765020 RepID=UPI002AABCB66|nr:DUF1848 domain-containing protein [uncultured Paludibaculum sp.]